MRLEVISFSKTHLVDAVAKINEWHMAPTVVQFEVNKDHHINHVVNVIVRYTDYPQYTHYCKKRGVEPMTSEEFFK